MTSSTTIEALYVVDTHALIWYLTNSPKLSSRASAIFNAAEQGETRLVVSAIVIAEMFYTNQKQHFFDDFPKVFADLKTRPYIRLIAFSPNDVQDFGRDAKIPEMHDRIIAGLARRFNVPLVTRDPQIASAGIARIAW